MFARRAFDPGDPRKFEPGGAGGVLGAASIFNDGRSAAWAGTTLAGCPYINPLLASAWACGRRAGQAERRARHG